MALSGLDSPDNYPLLAWTFYHPPVSRRGLVRRCFECMNVPAIQTSHAGLRCEPCDRRWKKRKQ